MSNELQTIPISSLCVLREQPHVFDERKLKELAQSIKAQGIKVRLIVRQGEEGKFEISRCPPLPCRAARSTNRGSS